MVQAVEVPITDYILSGLGPFNTAWTYADAADVTAVLVLADGTEQQLGQGAEYTLTGAAPLVNGGAVLLSSAVYGAVPVWAAGTILSLRRATADDQSASFGAQQGFTPQTYERMFDRIYRRLQELKADLGQVSTDLFRAIKVPAGEQGLVIPSAAARAGKIFAFAAFTGAVSLLTPAAAGVGAAIDLSNVLDTSILNGLRRAGLFANPREFGAVGDGVANDTVPVGQALATGLSVLLSPGTYKVNPASLTYSNVPGQGIWSLNRAATTIKLASAPTGSAMITMPAVDQYIRDVTLDGGGFISTTPVTTVLVNASADRFRIERVTANNFAEMAFYTAGGAKDGKIRDCVTNGTQLYGVKITTAGVTAGSLGTNGVGRPAVFNGGTVLGGRIPKATYDVVGGSVTNVQFSDYGRYNVLGALPTISFPAVPNASATLRFAADLNSALSVGITGAIQENIEVSGCTFVNGGIHFRGFRCKAFNNELTGAVYGTAIGSANEAGCGLNEFFDNHIHDCGRITGTTTLSPLSTDGLAADPGLPCNGFEIYGSGDSLQRNRVETVPGVGIFMASNGGKINGNEVSSCGAYWHSLGSGSWFNAAGIMVSFLNSLAPGTNISVTNNRSFDSGQGFQHYGFVIGHASVGGLVLEDNNCQNNVTAPYYNAVAVVPARFKGARIVGHIVWDPAAITTGTDTFVDVPVSGFDVAGRWIPTPFFSGVATEWVQLSASWLSPNVARLRMFSMSGSYNLAAGVASVAIDELFPLS